MQPLPDYILAKMDEANPAVLDALSQLEAFLAPYNMCLYASTSKDAYVRDLTLMMAVDDLDAIASVLLDATGNPIAEHRVNMQPANDVHPSFQRFKRRVRRRRQCSIPYECVADHVTPMLDRKGKTNYEEWLLIPWEDDPTPTPELLSHASVRSLAQEGEGRKLGHEPNVDCIESVSQKLLE